MSGSARHFGAWLGLVPKHESTGDRTILGKISKRGNKYLRTLFVQAAHIVLVRRPSAAMRGLWPWIEQACGFNPLRSIQRPLWLLQASVGLFGEIIAQTA
jgi:hypothetical protein